MSDVWTGMAGMGLGDAAQGDQKRFRFLRIFQGAVFRYSTAKAGFCRNSWIVALS